MIAAEGEQKASRALREAANVIAESSSALQVHTVNPRLEVELYYKSPLLEVGQFRQILPLDTTEIIFF